MTTAPIDDLIAVVPAEQQDAVRALIKPVAGGNAVPAPQPHGLFRRKTATLPAPRITDSYVGGHPFLPTTHTWPVSEKTAEPMHFIVQVNFADVPPLPGFPTEGLLQMFVESDDTWGLTFDDTMGLNGFHCRWFSAADLTQPVSVIPTSPIPVPTDTATPVIDPHTPHLLQFDLTHMIPQGGWEHSPNAIAAHPDGFAALETAWDDHEDIADATLDGWDVHVGGWPSFVQGAPATPAGRSSQLLLGINSGDLMMWGDVGTAHLFGDPAALAAGDLSGFWWEWACS